MSGVFAVNKPSGCSSQEIVGKLKHIFSKSEFFKPEKGNKKFIKIGHGGTLDPLASGVLVIGVGKGTKKLSQYLGKCTKQYKAVALFGASTTTYDSDGSILERSARSKLNPNYLTNDLIQSTLPAFRGDILQAPPVYSALKMDGKRLYEYAREGKDLPKEILPRPCTIEHLDCSPLIYDHEFKLPSNEASPQEKEFAFKVQQIEQKSLEKEVPQSTENKEESEGGAPSPEEANGDNSSDVQLPIIELTFSVSSGTYIRSLIHDIAKSVGLTAHMVKLTRTKQAEFKLDDPESVLELELFTEQPESVWKPKLEAVLKTQQK